MPVSYFQNCNIYKITMYTKYTKNKASTSSIAYPGNDSLLFLAELSSTRRSPSTNSASQEPIILDSQLPQGNTSQSSSPVRRDQQFQSLPAAMSHGTTSTNQGHSCHQLFSTNHFTGTPERDSVAARLGSLAFDLIRTESGNCTTAIHMATNDSTSVDSIQNTTSLSDEEASVDGDSNNAFVSSVTDEYWFTALQEEKNANPKYQTNRCYWPSIWKMAGLFLDNFKRADFFKTRNLSNAADFKVKLVQHILSMRCLVEKTEIPEKYLVGIDSSNSSKETFFYYSKEAFMKHCVESYKYDLKIRKKIPDKTGVS